MPYDKAQQCQSVIDRLLLMKDRDQDSQLRQLQEVLTILSERVAELEKALLGENEITLKSGNASLRLRSDGTINIQGKDLNLDGSGRINIKASSDVTIKAHRILQN